MKVLVNKREKIVPIDCSIAELVAIYGLEQNFAIAVAVGTKVIPRNKWLETKLQENDTVTLIEATCGG